MKKRKWCQHLTTLKILKIFTQLRERYAARLPNRKAMQNYLCRIYRLVRRNSENRFFDEAINRCLKRYLSSNNVFAHVIEITSDLDRRRRWVYAHALAVADDYEIPADRLIEFIANNGGYRGVISMARRSSDP